jgi:hypothetical protein
MTKSKSPPPLSSMDGPILNQERRDYPHPINMKQINIPEVYASMMIAPRMKPSKGTTTTCIIFLLLAFSFS